MHAHKEEEGEKKGRATTEFIYFRQLLGPLLLWHSKNAHGEWETATYMPRYEYG